VSSTVWWCVLRNERIAPAHSGKDKRRMRGVTTTESISYKGREGGREEEVRREFSNTEKVTVYRLTSSAINK